MKVNLTIELPLKNPEEVLDLGKLTSALDSNYVNSINDLKPFRIVADKTGEELVNEAFFTSTTVAKMLADLTEKTAMIKNTFAERISYNVTFPEDVVREFPDLPKYWITAKDGYNKLQQEAFAAFEMVDGLVSSTVFLVNLVRELFANGLPKLDSMRSQIKSLNEEIENNEIKAQNALKQCVENCQIEIEKMRVKMHEKDKLVIVKDRRVIELEKQVELLKSDLKTTQETLSETSNQVANKYTDFQELNKYIGELFKDKKKAIELMSEKDALIAKLQQELADLTEKMHELKKEKYTDDLLASRQLNDIYAKKIDDLETKLAEKVEPQPQPQPQPQVKSKNEMLISRVLASQVNEPPVSTLRNLEESRLLARDLSTIYRDKITDWLKPIKEE